MNTKETISYIKSIAKNAGLTFKRTGSGCVNSIDYYSFFERGTSNAVLENTTLSVALEDSVSGYIESWNGNKFDGTG
jgi:hypothetical protein